MSDSKENSDSDVESNSSWTLLTEDAAGDNDRLTEKDDQQQPVVIVEPLRKVETLLQIKEFNSSNISSNIKSLECDSDKVGDIETFSTTSSISLESLSETATGGTVAKQGCLTLEEYLAAEELSHDCDYDSRAETWEHAWDCNKRGKRKQRKCKAENITTLTVVGAVLSLAGISLMCMMTPFLSKQLLSADLQNKVENNFTKIESSYATANGLKVYIDKSNKGMKFLNNAEVLEPFLKQCGTVHTLNAKSTSGIKKSEKINKPNPVEQPLTYEQFLKEKPGRKTLDSEKQADGKGEAVAKPKSEKREKTSKISKLENKELKVHPKSLKTNEENKVKPEQLEEKLERHRSRSSATSRSSKAKDVPEEIPNKKELKETKGAVGVKKIEKPQSDGRKERKEFKLKKTLEKTSRCGKATSRKICRIEGPKIEDIKRTEPDAQKKFEGKKTAGENIRTSKSIEKIGSALQRIVKSTAKVREPNFVLVNSKATKSMSPNEAELPQMEKGPIEKIMTTPKKKVANNLVTKKNENTTPSNVPNVSSIPWYSRISNTDIIACQLLQDICLLKLTSKLKEEAKARQKRLKRKLERRRLRSSKTYVNEQEEEEKVSKKKQKKPNTECEKHAVENDSQVKPKPQPFSFKPKLVNSHFIAEPNPTALSNFDLLKELPFMSEPKRERKDTTALRRPTTAPVEKTLSDRIQYIVGNVPHGKVTKRRNNPRRAISFKEIVTSCEKSKRFLETTKKTNEEKLKMLEQMKLENRLKMEELIRARRERMKKDASLGIYNVPFPNYADVSDELNYLKNTKIQRGFFFDSLTSSDSESERFFPRNIESKISNEFMTALKVGKKVSDTFREWTLKKAPTLTSLKNYCNSKVSQISERLSNQCTNQTSIESTVDKEELEALKSRKEKHEQLKKFWKTKQDYLDKRIEICDLLKQKLAPQNIKEETMAQGVHILDSIISDVLKTVKNSKSCVDRSHHSAQNKTKTASKSVVALVATNKPPAGEQPVVQNTDRESYCGTPDDLYSWLFERRAVAIKRRDQHMWNPVNPKPGYAERKREVSKQDPSRGYQEKIIKKHN